MGFRKTRSVFVCPVILGILVNWIIVNHSCDFVELV